MSEKNIAYDVPFVEMPVAGSTKSEADYGSLIPDHAIERIAKFLYPKFLEDQNIEKES